MICEGYIYGSNNNHTIQKYQFLPVAQITVLLCIKIIIQIKINCIIVD